jgi:SAM-dependent methyltransferase
MSSLPYLNLGCGYHFDKRWVNVDFDSTGEGVIAHNLISGIPFPDAHFEVVYHSHILEHFLKPDAEKFIAECYRVLKPGGIIRVVVPDLERSVRGYIKSLENIIQNPDNEVFASNYEWMMIELLDQCVRTTSGGEMLRFLSRKSIPNEDFIAERVGNKVLKIRKNFIEKANFLNENIETKTPKVSTIRQIRRILAKFILGNEYREDAAEKLQLADFRTGGEVHQWMYDRFSLPKLMEKSGFSEIRLQDAFTSYIPDFAVYHLDAENGIIRKPDSLFAEARKAERKV